MRDDSLQLYGMPWKLQLINCANLVIVGSTQNIKYFVGIFLDITYFRGKYFF